MRIAGVKLKAFLKRGKKQKSHEQKACSKFPGLERKGGPSAAQMGESRLLYVRTKGNIAEALSIIYLS